MILQIFQRQILVKNGHSHEFLLYLFFLERRLKKKITNRFARFVLSRELVELEQLMAKLLIDKTEYGSTIDSSVVTYRVHCNFIFK